MLINLENSSGVEPNLFSALRIKSFVLHFITSPVILFFLVHNISMAVIMFFTKSIHLLSIKEAVKTAKKNARRIASVYFER